MPMPHTPEFSLCKSVVGFEPMCFSPIVLFQSFTELANTTEKSQLKKGLLSEQDAVAQFGSQKAPVGQQIHRMFLLRVKLMHFVNSLHNYIMTRVGICHLPQFCRFMYLFVHRAQPIKFWQYKGVPKYL